ncbi:hypothetical protein AK830_g10835 [Neonectria ditissima]|uniref:Uncharacterized protein n=1 Tax=Neonectria ditissima TaxID=78410 RepID=A0A0P7AER6_9HYPO|nr:hypothetical protein AK830_g10835 [Neonectria ditissima]
MPAIYYVEEITHGRSNDELALSIRWNGAGMVINIDRNLASDVVENSLFDKYLAASLRDEEYGDVGEAGQALLDQLAPPSVSAPSDLHSVMFPQLFSFNLVTVSGELKLLLERSHQLEASETPGKGHEMATTIVGSGLPHTVFTILILA